MLAFAFQRKPHGQDVAQTLGRAQLHSAVMRLDYLLRNVET
jgi:hypothetical protein